MFGMMVYEWSRLVYARNNVGCKVYQRGWKALLTAKRFSEGFQDWSGRKAMVPDLLTLDVHRDDIRVEEWLEGLLVFLLITCKSLDEIKTPSADGVEILT